ncbi:hypothetical protein niasHT_038245 [Heterodera trifolii]|uniref:AAA+ ATPase domain-containing protein n=1 Tax=Heterodera trifolii TaxID=157864 RepID=A0ABD2I0E0_9BILA
MPQSLDIGAFASVFPAEPAYTYKDLFEMPLNEKLVHLKMDINFVTDIVEQLEEHVSLLREPGRHVWCQLPKALVLYGLSGIGKTHIAKTIAREANCRFVKMVAMSENLLLHSSSGREMTVDGTFASATFHPCVLLIKNIGLLCRTRLQNAINRTKRIDGFLMVGTTNDCQQEEMFSNLALYREFHPLEDARDSIVRGLAAHEIRHAVVAVLDRDATPLRYVTIIAKSGALRELPEVVQQLKEHVSLLHEPGRHVWCQLPKALLLYGIFCYISPVCAVDQADHEIGHAMA